MKKIIQTHISGHSMRYCVDFFGFEVNIYINIILSLAFNNIIVHFSHIFLPQIKLQLRKHDKTILCAYKLSYIDI